MVLLLLALLALAAALLAGPATSSSPPAPTGIQVAAYRETTGQRMLDRAETRTGDWYAWGGTGPWVFDCSGLVDWSAGSIGLRGWPRTTYGIIAAVWSGRLSYTSHPVRGDLAFFGPGHVEFVTVWYHTTFGAQQPGTRVGWHRWSGWWQPTFYLHINWLPASLTGLGAGLFPRAGWPGPSCCPSRNRHRLWGV